MKKKLVTLLALCFITPLLTQCASQTDVNKLNYQLRVVNKKLEDMKQGTVDQMQQRQAASTSQLDGLRQEILILKGKIDEMAHFNRQLKEQSKELGMTFQQYSQTVSEELKTEQGALLTRLQETQSRLEETESKLEQQRDILENIQEARIRDAKLKAETAARKAEKARSRANASASVLKNNSDSSVLTISADRQKKVISDNASASDSVAAATPEIADKPVETVKADTAAKKPDLIEAADQAFAAGKFNSAYELYLRYAQENPNSDNAVKARFMLGESLFYQKEYDQAILEYQKIISNNSSHPRAASALLKQGMAFEELSDIETAKIIYRKIGATYPSSPEAVTAKERSAKLN
ncbi:MAG TPA: tol-pal system protein YbgF [Desulfopila sp.]|nr:tol-pal system protein YbgF [Desulfopila sp.]